MAKATFKHMGYDLSFTDSDVVNARYDYVAQGESNPHNVRPWFAHDHGFCLGVCFASCEGDALDILADEGKLDRFQVAQEDMADYGEEEEGIARLGNASEPFDIESLGLFALPHVPFSFAAMFMAAQKTVHLSVPRTGESLCGIEGETTANIDFVTCDTCYSSHEKIIEADETAQTVDA